jgi:hypothetical protein
LVCGAECPGCAAVGGRLVLTVRCCFPVAGLAIALAKAEVSGGTDGVVCDDEFDVLAEVCPSPVRMVSLSVMLGED